MSQQENKNSLRTIALEEHFVTPEFMEGPGQSLKARAEAVRDHPQAAAGSVRLIEQLSDLDTHRIAAMDVAGIGMQVLSLTAPGVEQLEAQDAVRLACQVNDSLAEAIRRHPDRLAGFAALPTPAPDKAADELERTVRAYGFKGAMINGHSRGRYLDDPFFWSILGRAEALRVPIYLHPTPPPKAVIDALYTGNFAREIGLAFSTAGWGWHIDTALHVLRLVLSGAFDRYPNLQFIVGHLGESLPFMLQRTNHAMPKELTKLQRPIGDYLRENLFYTISGFNFTATFLDLLLEVGVDRIMFSTDYPFALMAEARAFLDNLPLKPAEIERIAHGNAEELLRI